MKIEPPADIRAASQALFNMYQALIDAGFTEAQALVIVGQGLAAAIGKQ